MVNDKDMMGILPSISSISTTTWLHHLDFNKMLEKKKKKT